MNPVIRNQMKMEIDMALGQLALPREALVSSYDPGHYAVKVKLQPEDTETGWLPIAAQWIGNSWGMFAPPSIGDAVAVHFYHGSHEAGYAACRFFNDTDVPLHVPSGEFWLLHKNGQFLKLTNDGLISIGGVGSLHQLVTDAFQTLFNNHTHGGGPKPDQPMGASHLTSILKAN